jgi:Protein of unknown function (DUF1329)
MSRTTDDIIVYSELAHLSDVSFPVTVPDNGGYFYARYIEQIAPEQGKYTTTLDLSPLDPAKVDELYAYIPSLRRSLRLSVTARCSPLFGTDMTIDDDNLGIPGLPGLFQVKYLGEKKVLALLNANYDAFDSAGTFTGLLDKYYYRGKVGVAPFPTPAEGKWEVRDAYVIDVERLPQYAAGYCYGRRILYVDKENFVASEIDLYDTSGKIYKWMPTFYSPQTIPDTTDKTDVTVASSTTYTMNFQDGHMTIFTGIHGCLNRDCAKFGYLDVGRYASPAGLMKIGQ